MPKDRSNPWLEGTTEGESQRLKHQAAQQRPEPFSVWRHYKGGLYVVITVGNLSEDRGVEMVVYRSCFKKKVWIRPLSMWYEQIDVGDDLGDSRLVQRFTEVENR